MRTRNILAIIGSASSNSSNLSLVNKIAELTSVDFNFTIYDRLFELPHFNPELSIGETPKSVLDFREMVLANDGIIICTPEYIFSIPSGLKNAIEWCVATTVFSKKTLGIITASANGQKGHEELQLIMSTVEASFTQATTLLIQGIKGKIDANGNIPDNKTDGDLKLFIESFKQLVNAGHQ
ncbi:MAG: NAD(P)H-dependent oxidoreductase [Bacteroidota bacterium]|nr:NAD(P)H-dependent oxidoreductase [Bacteroidota bacterium]